MNNEPNQFFKIVKQSLMIPLVDHYADEELTLHIDSCRALIRSAGISEAVLDSENKIVEGLVLIYVKTFFGFKNDGSVKELPPSFGMLLRQLILTSEVT